MNQITQEEAVALAEKAGFHFKDAGYAPILHTVALEYSQECFVRLLTKRDQQVIEQLAQESVVMPSVSIEPVSQTEICEAPEVREAIATMQAKLDAAVKHSKNLERIHVQDTYALADKQAKLEQERNSHFEAMRHLSNNHSILFTKLEQSQQELEMLKGAWPTKAKALELKARVAELEKERDHLQELFRRAPSDSYCIQIDFGDFHNRKIFTNYDRKMVGRIAETMLLEIENAVSIRRTP